MADLRDPHPDHDPELIAGLLDRDLEPGVRAMVEARVAACPGCAALHADLRTLATATRDLPAPARPRAFLLTAADAERLTAERAGEPVRPVTRPAEVIPAARPSATHATHDAVLVASLVDDALAPAERAAAEALVAGCGACAALRDDLVALRVATRALPTPPRPRDFVLAPDDAGRLRPGGWRRFGAAFGSSRDMLSRPLAFGLTSLGLAGLLVATAPTVFLSSGGAASPASLDDGNGQARIEAASGAPRDASGQGPGAVASAGPTTAEQAPGFGALGSRGPITPTSNGAGSGSVLVDGASPTPAPDDASVKSVGQPPQPANDRSSLETYLATGANGISMLVVLSAAFLITGLGLFAIRWTARRLHRA